MPIYEYHCASCGADLEKIQKFSDPVLTDCPSCGKASLKKLVSASSFRLKGSGWYETDFKTKKKTVAGEGNSAESKTAKRSESSGKSDKSEKSTAKKPDKE